MEIYIVWDMNADSWSGRTTMISIHESLEGAHAKILSEMKTTEEKLQELKRDLYVNYVENFTYMAIEKRTLLP